MCGYVRLGWFWSRKVRCRNGWQSGRSEEAMRVKKTERGFRMVVHETYPPEGKESRIVQESSAIGDYDDSLSKPGSSYLWVGDHHHLNRQEVEELMKHLHCWLLTGNLA